MLNSHLLIEHQLLIISLILFIIVMPLQVKQLVEELMLLQQVKKEMFHLNSISIHMDGGDMI